MIWLAGEVGRVQNFHVTRSNGSDFDLTGKTIGLIVYNADGSAQTERVVTITSATTGRCSYTTVAGDAANPGKQAYRLKIYITTNPVYYSDPPGILVVAPLGVAAS